MKVKFFCLFLVVHLGEFLVVVAIVAAARCCRCGVGTFPPVLGGVCFTTAVGFRVLIWLLLLVLLFAVVVLVVVVV